MDRLNRWGASARGIFNKIQNEGPKLVSAGLTALRRLDQGLSKLQSAGRRIENVYESAKRENLVPENIKNKAEKISRDVNNKLAEARDVTQRIQRVGEVLKRQIT